MKLAFYESETDKVPAKVDAEWDELAELLSDVEVTDCCPGGVWHIVERHEDRTDISGGKDCPRKYGRAWSPVDIEGERRDMEKVNAITVAVFDVDHVTEEQVYTMAQAIEGFDYVVHSTHNHNPPEFSLRLVMRLSRPIPKALWRATLKNMVSTLGIPADPVCKDESRLYFFPTSPSAERVLVERGMGSPLDVDLYLPKDSTGTRVVASEPSHDVPTLADLRERLVSSRKRKASSTKPDDKERYDVLGRILKGEALAPNGERDNTVNKAAALLAFILPPDAPKEALVELMRPSIAAMPYEPEGVQHWLDRAVFSFSRAQERRAERDADKQAADERLKRNLLALSQPSAKTSPATHEMQSSCEAEGDGGIEDDSSPVAEDDDTWAADLIQRADGSPKACGENVVLILSRCPEVKGSFRFNEINKTVEVLRGPFKDVTPDVLDTTVTDWLMRKFGLSLAKGEVGDRIMKVARMNSYNPLQQYLTSLTWDGTKRAHTLLTDYFDACLTNARGDDITQHVRSIGEKWLISAVARALDPGCQVDTVLVLEGNQGIRKTSAFRALGGEWFCDTQLALGDKDSKMLTASNWIIELAELASFKRSEVEGQKAFLTTRTDKYRPPYARANVSCPRMCVFVGTVNPDEGGYLTDRTGNRRYWPVWCNKINLEALEQDRDQLWAEAVHLYRAGERWWLDEDEQVIADKQAEERVGDSHIEAKIAEWWYALHPDKRPEFVTMNQVAELALKMPFERITHSLSTEIGRSLKGLLFDKQRRSMNGRQTYIYIPTKAMREAKQQTRPLGHLHAVADIVKAKVSK
jgi:predicted P-loop ATPase